MGYLKRNNMSSLINLGVYDMIVVSRDMRRSSHANLVRASSLLLRRLDSTEFQKVKIVSCLYLIYCEAILLKETQPDGVAIRWNVEGKKNKKSHNTNAS
ncbi:hypothetical protein C5167_024349 [Papaver somniferum]|uniref:Uncharacterized protein n=1 Tax=Papaver somniferum TaxID=3469 RepID=A0A4Y7JRM6_PAPSO|nr:hypothetical protein C5167_024349 [Papaver somniferum]